MHALPLILFLLTYLGLGFGQVRPLTLDRTGWAMVGAIAFLVTGSLPFSAVTGSIDQATLAVLFSMMLLSEQYRSAGLYAAFGRRLASVSHPRRLLAGIIVGAATLSAVLTNDVVCFTLTPLLGEALVKARRDPLPYLLALAAASNLGSALTPIGNPQNIFISQHLQLGFASFVVACAPPVVVSLLALYALLARRVNVPTANPPPAPEQSDIPLQPWRAAKAIGLTVVVIVLFLTPGVPAPLAALGVAGAVLVSRSFPVRASLERVDWPLLCLFVGLFVVVRGFEVSGWADAAAQTLLRHGLDLTKPAVLVPVTAVLSNLVSNVPAVMLLLPLAGRNAANGYALALASTLAGNALLIASIANLIVAERAAAVGIRIRFIDHLRVGLPVTLISLGAAIGWLVLRS
jgi:Na+/H+ antiporter NhaD/arsenite permease-like protein